VKTNEGYPEDWARVVLMVSPDGMTLHAIGGDRGPGDGDMPYVGLERLRKAQVALAGQPHAIANISGDKLKVKLVNVPDPWNCKCLEKLESMCKVEAAGDGHDIGVGG
jgi:hypothetical protein